MSEWRAGLATPKQEAYLLRLAGVRHLSQVPGIRGADLRGGLLAWRASEAIAELLAAQAAEEAAPAIPATANRLDEAAELADHLAELASTPVVASADLGPYLAGAEDALRWVLGLVPADTVEKAIAELRRPR